MDILTFAGIAVAVGSILGGQILEGGHPSSLLQMTAFLIVFGGTMGSVIERASNIARNACQASGNAPRAFVRNKGAFVPTVTA